MTPPLPLSQNAEEENRRLRRTLRDLVALSALPAAWVGLDQDGVAHSLASVLLATLSLDLVYIRLARPSGEGQTEIFRSKHCTDEARIEVVRTSLASLLDPDQAEAPAKVPHPFGPGTLNVAVTRFGIGADRGILVTGSPRAEYPTERDRLLLGVSANQTAIVVERQRVEEALHEETRALELLNKTGASIAAQLDLESVVQSVTDAGTELSGAKFGAFFYRTSDGGEDAFSLFALSGAPREAFERLGRPRATPIFAPTFRGEGVIRSDDIRSDPRYGNWDPHRGMPEGHLPVRSFLSVPVVSGSGHVLGGLFFGHPEPGVFTERSERIVKGIATQAAIAVYNANLYEAAQQEIGYRQRAEQALREADRRKDDFLAVLAHELRNPLAPIRQATGIARSGKASAEQLRWSHEVIERQVGHMALLLDDLLDVSRITRGRLSLRMAWTELADVVEDALETARPTLEAKQHQLVVELPEEPISVFADRLRLGQILANLLTNAARYTQPNGIVRVRAYPDADDVVLQVEDNGIGISSERLPLVFEMFSRAKQETDVAEGGLGIGLALVKGLVELHEGKIEAASSGPCRGSTFTVRIPVRKAERRSQAAPEKEEAYGTQTRRILVADDNRDSADSLAVLLRVHGHEVAVAYDGEEAIEIAESFRPNVCLLDIGMPKIDGYEAAKRIRSRFNAGQLTLIAVTGWGQEADKSRAIRAGFDYHLTKPVSSNQLSSLL